MRKKAATQRRVGGPTWKSGDPTITVSEIAQALTPIEQDVAGTLHRIRHWFREGMLLPVDQEHAGPGKHRLFSADAVFDAAVLHVLTAAVGLPVSGSRLLYDALTKARWAVPKWKAARAKGKVLELSLLIAVTANGMTAVGIREGEEDKGEEEKEIKKAAAEVMKNAVLKVELDLTKLFAQVTGRAA